MRRRSTALVATAVAVAGLAVVVVVVVLDRAGDDGTAAPSSDPCLATPPLVAVAGIVVPEEMGIPRVTVIHPDGSHAVVTGDWVATHPEFSPDGERLVVTRADGDYESAGPVSETLWTIGLDGSDPVPVTDGDVYDLAPSWSPDGTTLAFVRSTYRTTTVMTVPSAGGGEATTLVPAEGLDRFGDVAWSPDGSRLAFLRKQLTDDGRTATTSLWTVAADGSDPTRVTDIDIGAARLDWHPDGNRILVSSHRSEEGRLAVVDLATGGITVVARDATLGRWSRRGTRIVHYTRAGVTGEEPWRLVESTFDGEAVGEPRELGVTDALAGGTTQLSGSSDVAVAGCG